MTKRELLKMLTENAKEFRKDSGHYARNAHMHAVADCPSQDVIDAVLTGFINYVGVLQGVDYGLYARDLAVESAGEPVRY